MKEERINKPPILKVGDKVRVKSKEWFDAQEKDSDGDILLRELTPDGHYFTEEMKEHCGEEFYITGIEDRESVPYYKFRNSSFSWEFWMFDLIEDVEEPEYKVGDKIIVNSIEWYDKNKDDCGIIDLEDGGNFVGSMKECCGKVFTISDSYELDNQIYYHFKETGWAWQSWMFVPAIEEDSIEVEEHVDKKSEHHIYQIGDVVIPPSGEKAIIISTADPNYYNIVYTSNYESAHLLKGNRNMTLLEAGKYKDLINTELSPDIIARSLRNRFGIIAKSKSLSKEVEDMPKDSNSQSNSSEFDLTKVIYKSKRIY